MQPAPPEVALAVTEAERPDGQYTGYTDDDFDEMYLRAANSFSGKHLANWDDQHRLYLSNKGPAIQPNSNNALMQKHVKEAQYMFYGSFRESCSKLGSKKMIGRQHLEIIDIEPQLYNSFEGPALIVGPQNKEVNGIDENVLEDNQQSNTKLSMFITIIFLFRDKRLYDVFGQL